VWDIYREDVENWQDLRAQARREVSKRGEGVPEWLRGRGVGGDGEVREVDLFEGVDVGLRAFMELEKRLREEKTRRDGEMGGGEIRAKKGEGGMGVKESGGGLRVKSVDEVKDVVENKEEKEEREHNMSEMSLKQENEMGNKSESVMSVTKKRTAEKGETEQDLKGKETETDGDISVKEKEGAIPAKKSKKEKKRKAKRDQSAEEADNKDPDTTPKNKGKSKSKAKTGKNKKKSKETLDPLSEAILDTLNRGRRFD
jgi:hypothetical protein